jgi:hypothetical protein
MKKLGKITINPEKVIKNEKLSSLRGGDGLYCCFCSRGGYVLASEQECHNVCYSLFFTYGMWVC